MDGWAGVFNSVLRPRPLPRTHATAVTYGNCAFSQFLTRSSQTDGWTIRLTESREYVAIDEEADQCLTDEHGLYCRRAEAVIWVDVGCYKVR